MKKYTLVDKRITMGYVQYRVRALRDFGNVKEGDIGGCVTTENNLSHDGDCWIGYNISVLGHSIVQENASVKGTGHIYYHCIIGGNAILHLDKQSLDSRKHITLDHGYWKIIERRVGILYIGYSGSSGYIGYSGVSGRLSDDKYLISSTLEKIEI